MPYFAIKSRMRRDLRALCRDLALERIDIRDTGRGHVSLSLDGRRLLTVAGTPRAYDAELVRARARLLRIGRAPPNS